jgi:topoisomerase IA-like protein
MASAMVETTICDVCGKPADGTLNFKARNGKSLQLDVCAADAADLEGKAHAPRRGRRPGTVVKKTAAKKTPAKRTTRKAPTRKKAAAKKRTSRRGRVTA